jgi:hypothetical protein
MITLDLIRLRGIEIANKHDLVKLYEFNIIPFSDEIVADFVETEMYDLFEFQTLTAFENTDNLFARAFMYNYGKGAEFAFSHLLNNPIERIGYNFDECMTGSISELLPTEIKEFVIENSNIMSEMYSEMMITTKKSMDGLRSDGNNFGNALFVILNAAFYWGTRVVNSQFILEKLEVDFSSNNEDVKFDYDNYDQDYIESDYPFPKI